MAQHSKILGNIQIPSGCSGISVFDATLIETGPVVCFLVDNHDDVMYHQQSSRQDLTKVVELCSGMDIGTFGFEAAGMETVVAADWSEPLVKAFQEMHPGIHTVHGPIALSIHRLHPGASALMSGGLLPAPLLALDANDLDWSCVGKNCSLSFCMKLSWLSFFLPELSRSGGQERMWVPVQRFLP